MLIYSKLKSSSQLQKFIFITITILSSKLFLFMLPYIAGGEAYNSFNKVYYIASLISASATFGFGYAFVRYRISDSRLILYVILNILVVLAIFALSGIIPSDWMYLIFPAVISFPLIVHGIYSLSLLFDGEYKKFFAAGIIMTTIQVLALFVYSSGAGDLVLYFTISSFAGLLLSIPFFGKYERNKVKISGFYILGGSAFLINSAAIIAFSIDKIIVNYNFSLEAANAYTFSWTLIAPMFYLGNIVEKMIYTTKEKGAKKSLSNSILLLSLFLLLYSAILFTAANFFPQLFPSGIDRNLLTEIIPIMLGGYIIYILLQFPFNGILFRFGKVNTQKVIAFAHLLIIILFLLMKGYIESVTQGNSYLILLFYIWGYLFLLLSVKIGLIIKYEYYSDPLLKEESIRI
jgi:hypothetical protein